MPDTTVERTIAPKQLIALVKDASEKREKIASIAGELGERVKNAADNGHLHRGAFALMVRLNKMEEQKRNDFIRSFGIYSDHCQTALWGGSHVGDIVDLAKERKGRASDEGEPQAVDDAMAESLKNAEGIKPLDPEQHAENQKGKRRGRAKASAAAAELPEDPVEAAAERGRLDWLARKPGKIPEDLEGKPKEASAWLQEWERGQIASSKAHDAEDFERNPPKSALPGADAPGSYVAH